MKQLPNFLNTIFIQFRFRFIFVHHCKISIVLWVIVLLILHPFCSIWVCFDRSLEFGAHKSLRKWLDSSGKIGLGFGTLMLFSSSLLLFSETSLGTLCMVSLLPCLYQKYDTMSLSNPMSSQRTMYWSINS